jgi:serine/threonine protein phosphatase 1
MVAVIGDIHGCLNTLKDLVTRIRQKYPKVGIYAVGDLVDRGNFSFEVMEFFINEKIHFTAGNHDLMFYYFIKDPSSELGRIWMYNGSDKTINSYNNRFENISKHLDRIIKAPLFYYLRDCFISHAGISVHYKSKLSKNFFEKIDSLEPFLRTELMSEHGVLWTRDELLDIGKLQIVGHTRQQEVTYLKSNNVAYIDTSAYTGNKLSAVIVENDKIIDTISVATYKEDIQ